MAKAECSMPRSRIGEFLVRRNLALHRLRALDMDLVDIQCLLYTPFILSRNGSRAV